MMPAELIRLRAEHEAAAHRLIDAKDSYTGARDRVLKQHQYLEELKAKKVSGLITLRRLQEQLSLAREEKSEAGQNCFRINSDLHGVKRLTL